MNRYSHTQSRTWVHPNAQRKRKLADLNSARKRICPRSEIWPANYDIDEHRRSYNADKHRRALKTLERQMADRAHRRRFDLSDRPEVEIKSAALDGKEFGDNYSAVLSMPTVFCTEWQKRQKEISAWPEGVECKYEGDERRSTEAIHGRALPLPRLQGNETVAWQHRSMNEQYPLEDFVHAHQTVLDRSPWPWDVEVFLRWHYVADLEPTDEEGDFYLGKDLMEMLDE